MTLDVVTFGCRLNAYESDVIRREARDAGLADAVIVNTCAVTAEAERQARQAIRKLRRERPGARLIVTGCAAQIDAARFAAMPEIDQVLGNREKLRAENYRATESRVGDWSDAREPASDPVELPLLHRGIDGRARAIVQVQQGCDHRCTFCVIPFGRGPSRSLPAADVIAQARALVEAGYREIVLSGVDLTAYEPSLGTLVRDLLAALPELPRLRLSSLDPVEIEEPLWALLAEEPRLMPHLHLSIQAGDDLILKRMKRRHSRRQALDACARARELRPGIALGADLIAGFPTETEAMFENTLAFVAEAGLDYLHVFPFSARPGTPAARMPQVDRGLVKERARRLRDAGSRALAASLASRVGTVADVLIERDRLGRSEHGAPVRFASHPKSLSAPGGGEVRRGGGDSEPAHLTLTLSAQWAEREARPGSVVRMNLVASDAASLVGVPL